MRLFLTLDMAKSKEFGLTSNEAILFSWIYSLPSWAKFINFEDKLFYYASKIKACQELPFLTDKVDTMYRYYVSLEKKGLITLKKIDFKDYISLTDKAKQWNAYTNYGKNLKVENWQSESSEEHPNSSDVCPNSDSDVYPTDNINNVNSIYNNYNNNKHNNSEQEILKEETEKLSNDDSQTKFDTEINFSIDDAILYKNIPVLYKEDTDELLEYCDDYGITEYIPDNNTEQYNTTEYKYDKQTPKKNKTAKPKFSDRGADFKKVTKPRSKSVSINNLDDSLECVKIAKLYNSLSEMFPVQKIKFFSETLASQINGMIEQYGYDRYYNAVKLLLKDASFKTSRFNYPYKAHHILVDNTDRIEKFIDVDEDKLIHMEKFEEDFSNFKTEYDKIMRQTYPTKTELAEAKAMYAELSEEERQLAKKMIVHVMYHREMKMKEYLKLQIYKYDKAERTKILGCVSSQYDYRPLY